MRTALFVLLASSLAHAQQVEERYFLDQAGSEASTGDGRAAGALGSSEMRRANRVASQLLRRRMAADRGGDLRLLDEARDAEVIVVRGVFDRVQDVLRAIEVRHVVIPPRLLRRLPLLVHQTLMVNCPGNLGPGADEKVRAFVAGGGFLVTTDWALTLTSRAFPGTIRRAGRDTADDVVDVDVSPSEHPFLEHVHETGDTLRWWLEGSSYPVRVLDERAVEVLFTSEQMRRRYGHAPIVATFRHGEGQVLHTTSHFYLQRSRLETGRDRAEASVLARDMGLSDADVSALRAAGLSAARVGEVASAYAMQQLLSNVIVVKRRDNDRLLSTYRWRLRSATTLLSSREDGQPIAELLQGFLLREVAREGGSVKVRDLFGREGWVDAALLEDRFPPPPALARVHEPEPEQAVLDASLPEPAPAPVPPSSEASAGCATGRARPTPWALVLAAVLYRRSRRAGSSVSKRKP